MKLNKKLLVSVLVLLIISWTGNIIYYKSHMLKEPLFLKHYYDVKTGMPSFQLYYIDNIGSSIDVAGITFPEIAQEYVEFNKRDYNNDGRYYKMNIIDVIINRGNIENIPENFKNKVITKAQVQLTNGKVMDVDIGKIYLYSEELGKPALKTNRAMGSSDNSGGASFQADKYTKITGLYSKFPEIVEDAVRLSINGKPLENISFPIELEMGTNLEASYSFNFNKDDIRRNYAYNFTIDLPSEDRVGTKGSSYIFLNYWQQSPKTLDIDALKKDRGY